MAKKSFPSVDTWLARSLPYPKAAIIEPINVCQLRCPLCPTGLHKFASEPVMMPLETFKAILARIPFVSTVGLHRAGEPFLNPNTLEMIRYAAGRKIFVVLSTNFSFVRPEGFFADLVQSGLGRLIISLDGATRESYEQYRKGGDFDLVVGNLKKLVATKKRLHSKHPEIVWQFLVNRFNEHEIATATKMASEMAVTLDLRPLDMSDNLVDVPLDTTIEERKAFWLGKNENYICEQYQGEFHYPIYRGICHQLFTNIEITAEGKVLPCCGTWDKGSSFGDLMKQSFTDIWLGPEYVNSRLRALGGEVFSGKKTVCFRCNLFGTSPSRKDKFNLVRKILQLNLHHWQRRLRSFG